MSKHLSKGCPLTIEMIAKKRRFYQRWANDLFWSLPLEFRREVATERLLLYMDKYRYQTVLDSFK